MTSRARGVELRRAPVVAGFVVYPEKNEMVSDDLAAHWKTAFLIGRRDPRFMASGYHDQGIDAERQIDGIESIDCACWNPGRVETGMAGAIDVMCLFTGTECSGTVS